mmetsp:Transcript_45000/g.75685  ORF Transcript_45000/g.75685 Transcript_45000/m.75685 type:complete len:242 (-) Transcript_45000:3312-4037(-)
MMSNASLGSVMSSMYLASMSRKLDSALALMCPRSAVMISARRWQYARQKSIGNDGIFFFKRLARFEVPSSILSGSAICWKHSRMRSFNRNVIMSSPKRFRADASQILKNLNQIFACLSSLESSLATPACFTTALMCLLDPQWASQPRRQYRMLASRIAFTFLLTSRLCSRTSSVITGPPSSSSSTKSLTTFSMASFVSSSRICFSRKYFSISKSLMALSMRSRSLISMRFAIITNLTRPWY